MIDLDAAAAMIARRADRWRHLGLEVRAVTWRDQGEGWPPIKTDRSQVKEADSIGISLRRGSQEGEVVLFKGGWCDFIYWRGDATDPVRDVPGWPEGLTLDEFGLVLDRLADLFH